MTRGQFTISKANSITPVCVQFKYVEAVKFLGIIDKFGDIMRRTSNAERRYSCFAVNGLIEEVLSHSDAVNA